jgi:hypothetical protein
MPWLRGRNKRSGLTPALPQYVDQQQRTDTEADAVSPVADLHLCLREGRYATRLRRLDVIPIGSDQELFKLLKHQHERFRGRWRGIYSLHSLRTIKFVMFIMHKLELLDIRKEDDIPPPDKLHEYKYAYEPIPPDYVPPIGENHLMHLYYHPECADNNSHTLLDHFPRKVEERLEVCPVKGMSPGWGIHFVEGWDWDKIWVFAFVLFGLGSLTFGIAWSTMEHDIQGAFGVSSYMVTFLALAIGVAQVKLQPHK